MVEIICGEKGKGKTKHLLDKANTAVRDAQGNVVYLDKSQKHMYELNNKIRLINVTDFPVSNCDEFLGFICGLKDDQLQHAIEKLDIISEKYNVRFILSISKDEHDLPECAKAKVIVSL